MYIIPGIQQINISLEISVGAHFYNFNLMLLQTPPPTSAPPTIFFLAYNFAPRNTLQHPKNAELSEQ